jgi:hypothetical protein
MLCYSSHQVALLVTLQASYNFILRVLQPSLQCDVILQRQATLFIVRGQSSLRHSDDWGRYEIAAVADCDAAIAGRISWPHEPTPERNTSSTARYKRVETCRPRHSLVTGAWCQLQVGTRCRLVSATGAKRIERVADRYRLSQRSTSCARV